jgi:hypothetical protein
MNSPTPTDTHPTTPTHTHTPVRLLEELSHVLIGPWWAPVPSREGPGRQRRACGGCVCGWVGVLDRQEESKEEEEEEEEGVVFFLAVWGNTGWGEAGISGVGERMYVCCSCRYGPIHPNPTTQTQANTDTDTDTGPPPPPTHPKKTHTRTRAPKPEDGAVLLLVGPLLAGHGPHAREEAQPVPLILHFDAGGYVWMCVWGHWDIGKGEKKVPAIHLPTHPPTTITTDPIQSIRLPSCTQSNLPPSPTTPAQQQTQDKPPPYLIQYRSGQRGPTIDTPGSAMHRPLYTNTPRGMHPFVPAPPLP